MILNPSQFASLRDFSRVVSANVGKQDKSRLLRVAFYDGAIELSAVNTTLQYWMTATTAGQGPDGGVLCIDGKVFQSVLTSIPEGVPVTIVVDKRKTDRLKIATDTSTFNLLTQSADDFPVQTMTLPDPVIGSFKMSKGVIDDLNAAAKFCDPKAVRFANDSVQCCLQPSTNTIRLAATDTKRLVIMHREVQDLKGDATVFFPVHVMRALSQLAGQDPVTVEFTEKLQVRVNGTGWTLVFVGPNKKFPPVHTMIQDRAVIATMPTDKAKQAARLARITTDEDSRGCRMNASLKHNRVAMASECAGNTLGDSEQEVTAGVQKDWRSRFDSELLETAFGMMNGEFSWQQDEADEAAKFACPTAAVIIMPLSEKD